MKKYLTVPVLISAGNLAAAILCQALGHPTEAKMFLGLFLGQWVQAPHKSVTEVAS